MIDWDFIAELEGGFLLTGYVPKGSSASGVTIYCGIDLGYITKAELKQLPPRLCVNLTPYVGLRGDAARDKVKKSPLVISKADGLALLKVKSDGMIAELNRHLSTPLQMDTLPAAVATVVMSITWQYGDSWADTKCGLFWHYVTVSDWVGLANYLMATKNAKSFFPDRRFSSRRYREGQYLKQRLIKVANA